MSVRDETQSLLRDLLVIKAQIDDAEKQLGQVVTQYAALYLKLDELLDSESLNQINEGD